MAGNKRSDKATDVSVMLPYPGENINFGDALYVADLDSVRYCRSLVNVLTAGGAAALGAYIGQSLTDYVDAVDGGIGGISISVKTAGTWLFEVQGGAVINLGESFTAYDDAVNLSATLVESITASAYAVTERIGVAVELGKDGQVWGLIQSRALLDGNLVAPA